MTNNLQTIERELKHLKKDVTYIKSVLSEDFELSEHAKKELAEARATPESDYVDLE